MVQMFMLIRNYLLLIGAVLPGVSCRVIRIPISLTPKTFELLAELNVDGQVLYASVDTGGIGTFFVWREWYEGTKPGGCETLQFKCYKCSPECKAGRTQVLHFADGTEVTVFKHSGLINFQGQKASVDFGLVSGYKWHRSASPTPIPNLGLSPEVVPSDLYKSLLEQLFVQKLISSKAYSMYLKRDRGVAGQLTIGGQDPSAFKPPLVFASVVTTSRVQLTGLRVGAAHYKNMVLSARALVDTGANVMCAPANVVKDIIGNITERASQKVVITNNRGYYFNCDQMKYLPSVSFFFKGTNGQEVPLEITPDAYVYTGIKRCQILFDDSPDGTWYIGRPALINHYIFFDFANRRIGFADVK